VPTLISSALESIVDGDEDEAFDDDFVIVIFLAFSYPNRCKNRKTLTASY